VSWPLGRKLAGEEVKKKGEVWKKEDPKERGAPSRGENQREKRGGT